MHVSQEGQFRAEVSVPADKAKLVTACARALQAKHKVSVQVAAGAEATAAATVALVGKEEDVHALEAIIKVPCRASTMRTRCIGKC